MFFCFLLQTHIVQLTKENIAMGFFEAFAIWEQACVYPSYKREKQLFLVFMGALNFGISIPSNMQLVFFIVSHTRI